MLSGLFSGFMVGTWLEASVMALVAGAVGFFVVLRGSSFAAHAIPQGAFTGAARDRVGVDAERHRGVGMAEAGHQLALGGACPRTGTHRYSNHVECLCSGSQVLHLAGALSTGQHWALFSVTSDA